MNASALREQALAWWSSGEPACVVQVLHTAGSAPREAGARLLVSATAVHGSIGGGHLEWQAIARARALLGQDCASPTSNGAAVTSRETGLQPGTPTRAHAPSADVPAAKVPAPEWPLTESFALGPSLGQCCGGRVTLQWRRLDDRALAEWPLPAPRLNVQLHGAGHVGSAIVRLLAGLDAAVDWVDERELPRPRAASARLGMRFDSDPVRALEQAPAGTALLVMTHRHDLDLAIVQAALRREDWAFVGLIGSATKRARFERRLLASGLDAGRIASLQCPIGLPGLTGKTPAEIALAVVAQLLMAIPAPAPAPAPGQALAPGPAAATAPTFRGQAWANRSSAATSSTRTR